MTAYQLTHILDLCRPGGAIDFVLIEPTLIRVPEPPRFFFGNFSDQLSEHYFKMTHIHPMGVFVCQHTTVTAPYLITHDTALWSARKRIFTRLIWTLYWTRGTSTRQKMGGGSTVIVQ